MVSILLCLIIVLEFFLSAESFNKPGFKALSKRDDIDKLIKIYDRAWVDTWEYYGVIPHPDCEVPFRICYQLKCTWGGDSHGPYDCVNSQGTLWCSTVFKHRKTKSKWRYCIMKGPNIADPNIWKAPSSCVRLFATYESKRKNWYYYKGCTTYNSEKPWCSHNYIHKAGKWSYCIDYTPLKWGEWENWSFCSKTCDEGRKTRTRKCFKGDRELIYGCSGSASESDSCFLTNCPVNGGWSLWNQWTNCSANCGNGTTIRRRLCNNPNPEYNGTLCDGKEFENKNCTLRECPKEEVKEEENILKKMSAKSGMFNIILYTILSIGALLAVVIAVVVYRRKKMGNSASRNEQSSVFYEESRN